MFLFVLFYQIISLIYLFDFHFNKFLDYYNTAQTNLLYKKKLTLSNHLVKMQKRKYNQKQQPQLIKKVKNQSGQFEEVKKSQKNKQVQKSSEQLTAQQNKLNNNLPSDQEFQDQFDDQFEQEEAWISASDSQDEEQNQKKKMQEEVPMQIKKKQKIKFSEKMNEELMQEPGLQQQEQMTQNKGVFLGSNKQLKKGEVLDFDNNAYDMLHRLNIEWPSLSIDFVYKSSPFEQFPGFQQMNKYPYQVYTVQGSCNNTKSNFVYFNKWTKLHRTKFDDNPDQVQEQQNADQQPQLFYQQAITTYDINRIRSLNGSPVVAFWNDAGSKGGQIHLMDLTANYQRLKNNITSKKPQNVKEIIIPFQTSGFALNWNPKKIGELVVGDGNGQITILTNNQNYTAWSTLRKYKYHKSSVQDIIFSPEQDFVFGSCSSDGTLQIVDTRVNQTKKSQLKINAHTKDVNVADWNSIAKHLIVTGSDDCQVKVWDLRMCKNNNSQELLCFNWHTQPITSIAFQPNQQSVIAVASQDNRLSIWDMSVQNEQEQPQIPNELMFLHQGQQQIKQIRFHPIYYDMVISSSIDSINVFKPSYQMPQEQQDCDKHDKEDLKRPPIKEEEIQKFLGRMSLGK